LYGLAGTLVCVQAHISLKSPCPRYSPTGENCPVVPAGQQLDQEMNAPISSVQQGFSKPFCKYSTPWPTPAAKWTAGQSITVKFGKHAVSHSGGHCEFSMSYDGGKTFVIIHQELQYCFVGQNLGVTNEVKIFDYTFDLPKDLPASDKAIFAWSWVNASGNREFYMNCADVAISGTSKSFTGKQMAVANYKGYPTIPEFNGNYNTGLDLYKNARSITVTGTGASSPANGPNGNIQDSNDAASDSGEDTGAFHKGNTENTDATEKGLTDDANDTDTNNAIDAATEGTDNAAPEDINDATTDSTSDADMDGAVEASEMDK
ncbi:hypothetical protein LPJ61_006967, partial [Coemansia biformis]